MLKAIWDFLMPRQRMLCPAVAFPRQAWPRDAAPPRILFTHGIMLEDDDYSTQEEPDSAAPSEPPVPDRAPGKKADPSSIIGIIAGLILLVLVIIALTL